MAAHTEGLGQVLAGTDGWRDQEVVVIERARNGDADAFGELVQHRLERLYRLAYAVTGNEADARDATQEAFISAWRELPRLREVDRFDAWLDRIVVNACRMRLRSQRRVREVPIDGIGEADLTRPAGRSAMAARPDAIAEADAINRAFERLGADDRVLLVLHHLQHRPVAEIARALGKPVGTVKWRLHEARRALDRALEAEAR